METDKRKPEKPVKRRSNLDKPPKPPRREIDLVPLNPMQSFLIQDNESQPFSNTNYLPVASDDTSNCELNNEVPKMNRHRLRLRKIIRKTDSRLKNSEFNSKIVCISSNKEDEVIRHLLLGKVFGYPNTKGTISSNYSMYIRNNHPFFSLFLAHPLHPFNRFKRFLVFTSMIFFTIAVTYFFTISNYWTSLVMCRDGCRRIEGPASSDNSTTIYCQDNIVPNLTYEYYHSHCIYYRPWELVALSGGVVVVWSSVLKALSSCYCGSKSSNRPMNDTMNPGDHSTESRAPPEEKGDSNSGRSRRSCCCCSCCCSCCSCWSSCCCCFSGLWYHILRFIEAMGGGLVFLAFSFSFVLMLWTLWDCWVYSFPYRFIVDCLIAKVWSLIEWFLWSTPFFFYKYPIDKKDFYRRLILHSDLEELGSNQPETSNESSSLV